jgi:hypothetical protein
MTPLTEAEFAAALATFERTAFRLELQPAYDEPYERDTVARFLTGHPQDPTDVPELAAWFDQIADLTSQGRTVERVRVHDDPPTAYQRWETWIDRWNRDAGETIHYLRRDQAHMIGLLPAAGPHDWWLLDNDRLIVMTFDVDGRSLGDFLHSDPYAVEQARTWRDLAIRGVLSPGAIPNL